MSATSELPLTHDVGSRISWTLRPAVSQKIDAAPLAQRKKVKPWADRRADMKRVCSSCHTSTYVDNFYVQYDSVVNMYNSKFAVPATEIYTKLRSSGLITADVDFDDEVEWTYFYLWHHEGRRARMGTAMFAPDYTQWHGFFEVAERFYMDFIPEVREVLDHTNADKQAAADEIEELIDAVLNRQEHQWYLGKESPETKAARKKAAEEFKLRYGK
jgi:hypothetical protein